MPEDGPFTTNFDQKIEDQINLNDNLIDDEEHNNLRSTIPKNELSNFLTGRYSGQRLLEDKNSISDIDNERDISNFKRESQFESPSKNTLEYKGSFAPVLIQDDSWTKKTNEKIL